MKFPKRANFYDRDDDDEEADFKHEAAKERKLALRAAKNAQVLSLVILDETEGAVATLHIGGAKVRDSLRMATAHRHLADTLESEVLKNTGMSKARLAKMYEEISDDTCDHSHTHAGRSHFHTDDRR